MQSLSPTPVQTNALPANPLALKDIHVPEQISSFPIAYGWWILTALVLLAIVLLIIQVKKSNKHNHVKKQALAQLKENTDLNNSELISLLKWAAMHYFTRIEIAKLYGNSLQQFLVQHLPEKYQTKFIELSAQAFKDQYQPNFHNEVDNNFQQAVQLWLTQALPPKQLKHTEQLSSAHSQTQKGEGVSA